MLWQFIWPSLRQIPGELQVQFGMTTVTGGHFAECREPRKLTIFELIFTACAIGPRWPINPPPSGSTWVESSDFNLKSEKCCQLFVVSGESCVPVRTFLPSHMIDGFESGVLSSMWESVSGGAIGLGCGALLPFAHGKTLYFNGCGLREAVTTDMDTTKARYLNFLQIQR